MVDIRYGAAIAISNGATIPIDRTLSVDAYNIIDVSVPKGGPLKVTLGTPSAKMQLLVVTASQYDEDLTYSFKTGGDAFALDQPVILAGAGIGVAGDFSSLFFSNSVAGDPTIDVQILVARDPLA